jgi:cysteinyl-tRNA synthetase
MLVYNTESARKETFEPWGTPVKMYVCGLTPKNEPHLGHARLFVAMDTIRRYLEYRGYEVRYIQNFTDVDDKIIAAGKREGIPPAEAAKRYIAAYFRDMDALNVKHATQFTYVTDFIPQIIRMVAGLIEKGYAYVSDGDVFFRVASFPAYGRLSGRDARAMLAGASQRVEVDEDKQDPRDFALWKAAKPGEPQWDSPWGPGRPGWHIECSTMILETLGPQIDIHGGGHDLIFPHHENEIAQSEAYTGISPFVKYWLHTGFFTIKEPEDEDDESAKMAHSGTFVTIRSVLERHRAPALRLYLLTQHYRSTMSYSEEGLASAETRWQRYVDARAAALRVLPWLEKGKSQTTPMAETRRTELEHTLRWARENFVASMDDDFNTPRALSILDELSHRINDYVTTISRGEASATAAPVLRHALATMEELTGVLGIQITPLPMPGEPVLAPQIVAEIERLIAERAAFRKARQWAEADRIRAELETVYGVTVKDHAQGTIWELKQG